MMSAKETAMSSVVNYSPRRKSKPARARRGALRRLTRAGARWVRNGASAWMVRKSIQKLESLDERTLADLGLSRCEIAPWARRYIMCDWTAAR